MAYLPNRLEAVFQPFCNSFWTDTKGNEELGGRPRIFEDVELSPWYKQADEADNQQRSWRPQYCLFHCIMSLNLICWDNVCRRICFNFDLSLENRNENYKKSSVCFFECIKCDLDFLLLESLIVGNQQSCWRLVLLCRFPGYRFCCVLMGNYLDPSIVFRNLGWDV